MSETKYSSTQKVAILMLSLGEKAAADMLKHLPRDEAQRVAQALSSLGRIDKAVADQVMEEFAKQIGQKPDTNQSSDFLRRLINQHLADTNGVVHNNLGLAGLPALKDFQTEHLARHLKNELPQTIAIILAHLEPIRFKATFALLPKNLHTEILIRMARAQAVPVDTLAEINDALQEELTSKNHDFFLHKVGGPENAAKMLNTLDSTEAQKILGQMTDRDPEMAQQIREHLFTFKDIVRVDDSDMPKLLSLIDRQDLLLALRQATEEVKNKIFDNLSSRARTLLEDDLTNHPKVPRTDVENAQRRIVEKILAKIESEEIRFSDDDRYI